MLAFYASLKIIWHGRQTSSIKNNSQKHAKVPGKHANHCIFQIQVQDSLKTLS